MTSALSLIDLSKHFRSVAALDSVSLDIAAGEFVALLGPSGSGKTTLLRLLAGFDVPTAGEIRIGDRNVSTLPPGARDIGMVFQHYALFPHLTVRRNIEYGLKMHGWSAERRKARVDELLDMVKLSAMAERTPRQLSGGQQQRVAIARALAYAPKILLMDEPLGALDRTLRVEMAEEIRDIHRRLGTTFIYVTHDRDEAMILADRVLIMHGGKIVADDTPETLFLRPNNEFVARFFSGMNICDGDVVGLPGLACFSPAAILFQPPADEHVALPCTMTDRLFLGERIQVTLSAAGQEVTAHVPTLSAFEFKRDAATTVYVPKSLIIPLGSN